MLPAAVIGQTVHYQTGSSVVLKVHDEIIHSFEFLGGQSGSAQALREWIRQ
jgi:hypothetical protein